MVSIERSTLGYDKRGKILSADDLKFYDENGYIVIRNCVPLKELEKYKKRFQQICMNEVRSDPVMVIMKDVADAKSKMYGEKVITRLLHFHLDDELFGYCTLPEVVSVAQDLVGPNLMVMHTTLINKPPDPGTLSSRHPLHQDLHYFPFRPADRIVCAWTAMELVNRANGCLVVVPGSHKGSLLNHEYPKWEGGVNKMFHGIENYDSSIPLTYLEMNAGDTIFFHPLLIHGSGANRTEGFRKAIGCHYAASECYYIDVRGSSQDNIRDEYMQLAQKRLGPNVAIGFEVD